MRAIGEWRTELRKDGRDSKDFKCLLYVMKNWEKIQCEKCWKRIEIKMWRTLCIRCTNQKYKESQAALRKARQQN